MINTICLCGSTRYLNDFAEANIELSKRGFSVVTISMALPKNAQGSEEESALKNYLDLVHLNKILRSDAVLVVGPGYFGHSTAREILWATMQGRPVLRKFMYDSWESLISSFLAGQNDDTLVRLAGFKLGLRSINEVRGMAGLDELTSL